MRHGQWSDAQWGSLAQFRQRDLLKPCRNCTHRQEDHDDDDVCGLCNCSFFEYEGTTYEETEDA